MLDADVTDSVIGEGCVIKVTQLANLFVVGYNFYPRQCNIKLFVGINSTFSLMQNCKIHHSVVGLRSCISEGAIIEDSLLMGADYYEVLLLPES